MGNSMSAIIAVVAMSTLLLVPDTSSAGAGGVSRSSGLGGGFRGAPIDGRRGGGFTGHRGAVGWSSGDVRAARGWRQPTWVRAQSPTPHLMVSLPNAKCIACSSLMNMVGAYVTWSCAPKAPGLDTAGESLLCDKVS